MIEKFVGELLNIITAQRYVNLYSKGFTRDEEDLQDMERFHSKLVEEYGSILINIDIKGFEDCDSNEEEAAVILELINKAIEINDFTDPIPDAISITDALEKLSKKLDRRVLLVFHCFSDIYDEKEKNILRAIRKFIEIFEKSRYLGILIISYRPTHHWELYPESKLDERHVAFKEYPLLTEPK
jgi:hypothetical protein